jgi:hypothetical protein
MQCKAAAPPNGAGVTDNDAKTFLATTRIIVKV